jgi:hypothetical protein
MATVPEPPLTAEEFGRRPDPGYPEELVRGRIATMPLPDLRQGQVCSQVVYLLRRVFWRITRLGTSRVTART